MAHFEFGETSNAVVPRTIETLWLVVRGRGERRRCRDAEEAVVETNTDSRSPTV
jgi:hypothetical protein